LSRPGSVLGKKLYGYLHSAKLAYNEGRLQESRDYYELLLTANSSLYRQAEDYVRASLVQQKDLRDSLKLARASLRQEKYPEAKQQFEKIIQDSKVKPLVLEF